MGNGIRVAKYQWRGKRRRRIKCHEASNVLPIGTRKSNLSLDRVPAVASFLSLSPLKNSIVIVARYVHHHIYISYHFATTKSRVTRSSNFCPASCLKRGRAEHETRVLIAYRSKFLISFEISAFLRAPLQLHGIPVST